MGAIKDITARLDALDRAAASLQDKDNHSAMALFVAAFSSKLLQPLPYKTPLLPLTSALVLQCDEVAATRETGKQLTSRILNFLNHLEPLELKNSLTERLLLPVDEEINLPFKTRIKSSYVALPVESRPFYYAIEYVPDAVAELTQRLQSTKASPENYDWLAEHLAYLLWRKRGIEIPSFVADCARDYSIENSVLVIRNFGTEENQAFLIEQVIGYFADWIPTTFNRYAHSAHFCHKSDAQTKITDIALTPFLLLADKFSGRDVKLRVLIALLNLIALPPPRLAGVETTYSHLHKFLTLLKIILSKPTLAELLPTVLADAKLQQNSFEFLADQYSSSLTFWRPLKTLVTGSYYLSSNYYSNTIEAMRAAILPLLQQILANPTSQVPSSITYCFSQLLAHLDMEIGKVDKLVETYQTLAPAELAVPEGTIYAAIGAARQYIWTVLDDMTVAFTAEDSVDSNSSSVSVRRFPHLQPITTGKYREDRSVQAFQKVINADYRRARLSFVEPTQLLAIVTTLRDSKALSLQEKFHFIARLLQIPVAFSFMPDSYPYALDLNNVIHYLGEQMIEEATSPYTPVILTILKILTDPLEQTLADRTPLHRYAVTLCGLLNPTLLTLLFDPSQPENANAFRQCLFQLLISPHALTPNAKSKIVRKGARLSRLEESSIDIVDLVQRPLIKVMLIEHSAEWAPLLFKSLMPKPSVTDVPMTMLSTETKTSDTDLETNMPIAELVTDVQKNNMLQRLSFDLLQKSFDTAYQAKQYLTATMLLVLTVEKFCLQQLNPSKRMFGLHAPKISGEKLAVNAELKRWSVKIAALLAEQSAADNNWLMAVEMPPITGTTEPLKEIKAMLFALQQMKSQQEQLLGEADNDLDEDETSRPTKRN